MKMKWFGLVGLIALDALGGSPLTLADAVTEARARGFDLRTAEAVVQQARADLVAARAVSNPSVAVGVGPSLGCFGPGCRGGSPGLTAQVSDQGALSQVLFGKVGLRGEVAQAGLRSAQAMRADTRRQIDALVKQQFIAVVVGERAVTLAREVRDGATQTSALMNERYRAGAVDEADVARVETQRFEAEQALDGATQNVVAQRAALALLLGRQASLAGVELDAADFLSGTPAKAFDGVTLEAMVNRALANRPDVLAELAQVEQAQSALALARRLRVPDVALVATYGQQGLSPDYSSPPNLTFGFSAPLPLLYQQQGEIDRAAAALEGERIQMERVRAQVRSDVETAWAAYLAASSQLRRMESGLKASATTARALVAVQYEKGTASLIELIDAQRTFVAVNVESLQVVQGYWTAVFRLEAALGQEQSS